MKTILLIEDNVEVSENTAEILEMANYQVLTATNGKTGVEMAVFCQPDLIISDIGMPEMNGFEVLKTIRDATIIRDTPFIFLSARSDSEDINLSRELGADAYLIKPCDGLKLLDIVSKII